MMIKFNKERALSNPLVKKAYEENKLEYELAASLIAARSKAKLTQEEVANKMATTQSFIARLESGQHFPSIKSLQKYARATNQEISITLHP